jgi:hypothetical protein
VRFYTVIIDVLFNLIINRNAMMALQKPLKTAIGLLSLAYNQAVTPLSTAEGVFCACVIPLYYFVTKYFIYII